MPYDDSLRPTLLQGTLDLLILATLARAPAHGYAIARSIERQSGELLTIEEGSLYPALKRLRRQGLIDAEWQTTHTGRRGKVYRLVAEGRDRLATDRQLWATFTGAVTRVLRGGGNAGPFDVESVGD